MATSNKRKRSDTGFTEPERPWPLHRVDSNVSQARPDVKKPISTACLACRKQKIKCDMPTENPPCNRCQRRGIGCVLHTSNRGPSVDHKQVGLLRTDVQNIFSTLERLCQHLAVDAPPPLLSEKPTVDGNLSLIAGNEADEDGVCELSPPASPSTVQAPIDAYLETALSEGPATGSSPRNQRRRPGERADLVSKGLITLESAELLVHRYLSRLDAYLYGICSHHQDIHGLRKASPTLFAAVCTVSSFHEVQDRDLFEICNKEYRHLVSSSTFEKRDSEFIRALCIGSFWLPDASRILSSDAIRRAADARLARNFSRLTSCGAADGSLTASPEDAFDMRDKVRLWYLLFICDQHLSILHNRDCLLRHERDIVLDTDGFLTSPGTTNQDIRIASQVSLLAIMGQIRDAFASDRMTPVPKSLAVQFNYFSRELDQWFTKFSVMFEPDANIGQFPYLGLQLHYQFGKLYLGHHVFRGLKTDPIPLHFLPAAATAHEAATTIFEMLLNSQQLKDNLIGVPHYFHIMISFAGHFLMELCMKHRDQLSIVVEDALRRISAVLSLFARMPAMAQHPFSRITTGLVRRLADCSTSLGLEPVTSGSPFGKFQNQLAGVNGYGYNGETAPGMAATFDFQASQQLPDEFLFSDFGNFAFQDMDATGSNLFAHLGA